MINRIKIFGLGIILLCGLIVFRLGYWQLIKGKELAAQADAQYFDSLEIAAKRGEILAADGSVLASSVPTFLLYAYKPNLTVDIGMLGSKLADLFAQTEDQISSDSARQKTKEEIKKDLVSQFTAKLSKDSVWEILAKKVGIKNKAEIESWHTTGFGFQPSWSRFYPEASSSAQILGIVGSDASGQPKGYFGLEGYYDRELRGVSGKLKQERDALGNPILVGRYTEIPPKTGRTIVVHIDKYIQRIVEKALLKGIKKYGANAGEVMIMDPKTGAIIASAAYPNFEPGIYWKFDQTLLKNPTISNSYEPGSTFKVFVMAAALDGGAVGPETKCDQCSGPVEIGPFVIRTWDNKYRPEVSMTDTIVHSDNTGMIFAAQKLGQEKLVSYIKKFGFGNLTGIDSQGEISPELREKWGDIDLATASFGQGIAVTTIQMLRAVAAIGNGGEMVVPEIADKIIGDKEIAIKPQSAGRPISKETSEEIKQMMITAVEEGEAKFAKPKGYRIAGKTGTAQIPVAGHYDKEKTIASFVGFAPADEPKFAMIVKLREPSSSPWGSETAAPLWFSIAKELLLYWNIPSDK